MKEGLGAEYAAELEREAGATRKCLERIPADAFDWKPGEKSMKMGDLARTVADIPNWIVSIVEKPELDFESYKGAQVTTTEELVAHFDKTLAAAKKALEHMPDDELQKQFSLKDHGKTLMTNIKRDDISSSINHLVHHRGQLTVYMKLKGLKVPPIYGPSGDEQVWS